MDHPSASSRAEAFPAGLRVLVVDDDLTWLKILEKMLRKCSYEVTTCCLARVALDMLRERKDKFDIVISDVNMPDMDGFKLLEHVGLEMDLPVIMMSVDGETSRVMKGVQHGACDYLFKPIRMKELRNIWQHVYRKKMQEVKEIESHDINEDIQITRNGSVDFDDRHLLSGADINSLRKRKDVDNKELADQDFNDSTAVKKARVVWSVDLHQKFVNAVNQIGFDKVGPKKILDLMNVPGLTRENVASHLQILVYASTPEYASMGNVPYYREKKTFHKIISFFCLREHFFKILDFYTKCRTMLNIAFWIQRAYGQDEKYRLYLSRLQKQNEGRALGGNMQSDLSSKNPPGNVSQHSSIGHQSSIAVQQNAATSGYVCATQKIHAEGIIPDIHVDDIKGIVSLQVTDSMEALDSQKVNSVSQLGVLLSFKGMVPNADHKSFEPSVSKHQPWSGVPLMQFMQYPKHDHEPYSLLEDYSLPPQSNQQHLAVADHLHTPPPVISITRDTQKDKTGLSQIKPVFMDYRSSHIKTISPIACTIDSVSVQVESGILNTQDSGVAYENSAIQSSKDSYLNQTNNHILIPPSRELCLKGEELALLPNDLNLCALQGIGCFDNVGLNSMEIFQYNDSASLTEVHDNWYDGLEFNYEYMYDSVIDECLFAQSSFQMD